MYASTGVRPYGCEGEADSREERGVVGGKKTVDGGVAATRCDETVRCKDSLTQRQTRDEA